MAKTHKVRPLRATYSPTHPYVIQRQDLDSGAITYEVWDLRPETYRRLCTLHEYYDGGVEDEKGRERSTVKQDAEMIVRALNLMNGGLP